MITFRSVASRPGRTSQVWLAAAAADQRIGAPAPAGTAARAPVHRCRRRLLESGAFRQGALHERGMVCP